MAQTEGLDVVRRRQATHSDLLVAVGADDEPVVGRRGLTGRRTTMKRHLASRSFSSVILLVPPPTTWTGDPSSARPPSAAPPPRTSTRHRTYPPPAARPRRD